MLVLSLRHSRAQASKSSCWMVELETMLMGRLMVWAPRSMSSTALVSTLFSSRYGHRNTLFSGPLRNNVDGQYELLNDDMCGVRVWRRGL